MTEPAVETRICPVCDESVPSDATRCPHCSTDLTLFQVDGERIEAGEDIETMNGDNTYVGELLKAANGNLFENADATASEEEEFQCPECNAILPGDATSCSNCGVEFAVGEVFECPLCKTLVDIDTDICPNCGAEFAEPDEISPDAEPVAAEAPAAEPEKPPEPPKEMSFAERMKAMKEEQAVPKPTAPAAKEPAPKAEPKKELSFAERMKAMKEGKEVPKAVAPSPATATPIATQTPAAGKPAVKKSAPTEKTGAKPAPVPKERYKELPALIGVVKKRLALAKRCNIDVTKSRALINQAVAAGKQKDLETAIRLVEEGKKGIEKSISDYLSGRFENLSARYEDIKKDGKGIAIVDTILPSIGTAIESSDYEMALDNLEKAERSITDSLGEDFVDAKSQFNQIEAAVKDAEVLSIDIGEAHKLYNEAKQAVELEDWNSASQYSKQGLDNLTKILPDKIGNEMKKAKNNLLEIKMKNLNITEPVEFLKQANASVREGKYTAALHSIREFKDYLDKEDL